MATERLTEMGRRLAGTAPYVGVVTAAAAVGIVAAVKEERAALWLERFHQLAAIVYVVLFALVLAAAITTVARAGGAADEPLRAALRAALWWSLLATFYGLLVGALHLPSGEGSVFVLGAISAYVGTAVALAFVGLVAEVSRGLRA